MAINKIERLDREIQKTREKITEYQNKLKELTAMLSGDAIPGMAALPADGYAEEQEDAANEE